MPPRSPPPRFAVFTLSDLTFVGPGGWGIKYGERMFDTISKVIVDVAGAHEVLLRQIGVSDAIRQGGGVRCNLPERCPSIGRCLIPTA